MLKCCQQVNVVRLVDSKGTVTYTMSVNTKNVIVTGSQKLIQTNDGVSQAQAQVWVIDWVRAEDAFT